LDPLPSSLLCYNTHHHHRLSNTLFSLLSLSFSISSQSPKFIHCPWDWKRMGLLIQTSPSPKIHPFSLQFQKWVGLFIQTSPSPKFIHLPCGFKNGWVYSSKYLPSPKFIHLPCSFKNGWVYSSKHLHIQNSSIFPAVSKMGGFIHPNSFISISISRVHPLPWRPGKGGLVVHSFQCSGSYEKMLQTPHRLSNQIYIYPLN